MVAEVWFFFRLQGRGLLGKRTCWPWSFFEEVYGRFRETQSIRETCAAAICGRVLDRIQLKYFCPQKLVPQVLVPQPSAGRRLIALSWSISVPKSWSLRYLCRSHLRDGAWSHWAEVFRSPKAGPPGTCAAAICGMVLDRIELKHFCPQKLVPQILVPQPSAGGHQWHCHIF